MQDKQLALDGDNKAWVIGIMVFVTLVKLFLVFYCRTYKNEIVRAYAQDHFFDVITNSIGLLAAFMASEFYWWMDPVGAILVMLHELHQNSQSLYFCFCCFNKIRKLLEGHGNRLPG